MSITNSSNRNALRGSNSVSSAENSRTWEPAVFIGILILFATAFLAYMLIPKPVRNDGVPPTEPVEIKPCPDVRVIVVAAPTPRRQYASNPPKSISKKTTTPKRPTVAAKPPAPKPSPDAHLIPWIVAAEKH